jgi:hypothetical protein
MVDKQTGKSSRERTFDSVHIVPKASMTHEMQTQTPLVVDKTLTEL